MKKNGFLLLLFLTLIFAGGNVLYAGGGGGGGVPPEDPVPEPQVCSSGYELVVLNDGSTVCNAIEYCDINGNVWPDDSTQTEGKITNCSLDPSENVVTASLSSDPKFINKVDSSRLTWSSSGATSCSGTGFVSGSGTSGYVSISPNVTTTYTVTCTGSTGKYIAKETLIITGLQPASPSIDSGTLNGEGNSITFKSVITNTGDSDITHSTPTYFELDLDNDGSYNVTLPSTTLSGLASGSSEEVVSSSWTSILGTHSVRAVIDIDGSSLDTPINDFCGIGDEGIISRIDSIINHSLQVFGGANIVNAALYAGGGGGGGGGECSGQQDAYDGTIIFDGTQRDAFSQAGSIINHDMQTFGGVSLGNADFYTGSKTGGSGETLDHVCKLIDPNSELVDYGARSYNSPGDNSIILWNGTSWEKHGASSYNSHVSGPFRCRVDIPDTYGEVYTFTVSLSQCSDGVDNDGDGYTDYPDDLGCSEIVDNDESDDPQCLDGIDNDGDGDIDYPNDSACSDANDDDEGSPAQCADGIDNDSDGATDLSDGACSSAGDNNESDNPQCSDGIDNDGDTRIDLADRGCSTIRDTNESDETALDPSVSISTIPALSLVRAGDPITVVWTASDITSCTVTGPTVSESYSSSPVSDQTSVTITSQSTYTITCDSEGVPSSDSVTIGIAPAFDEI